MKTIFVQIPSYRDPECQWTVKDIFARAKHPERVHIGICWQYDPALDAECFQQSERADQVRVNPFHWQESEGVCWARHQAQQLWDGEDYILSIDSHARFTSGWDEALISQLDECPSAKPVLSNHPAGYTPPDLLQPDARPTVLYPHLFTPQGDIRVRGFNLDRAPESPLKGAFCAGGFIFAKSEFLHEVPYDPYLYFDQEEISLSVRLFTHGFDIYSLKNVLLYHYYRDTVGHAAKQPRLHWDDNSDWMRLQERGRKRLNHLLGHTESENPEIIRDIEKYGLGSARSIEEYQNFCGVDFKKRTISARSLRGEFIENLSQYMNKPLQIPESEREAIVETDTVETATQESPSHPWAAHPAGFAQPEAIQRLIRENPLGTKLNIDREAPEGILIIYDYLDRKTCKMLTKYADTQTFTDLHVVDPDKSTPDKIVTMPDEGRVTNHVNIDGRAYEILNIFNDIHCRCMAPFYDVSFEWYERPQILRYPAGGKYNQHADSDHWLADKDEWIRVQDRDYSVLLYLNDEYEGGELELVNQDFRIKPKPGMLLAFPSDHRYLHAALPTTSGIRYVIVSWAAVVGSRRVRPQMPHASIYIRQKRGA